MLRLFQGPNDLSIPSRCEALVGDISKHDRRVRPGRRRAKWRRKKGHGYDRWRTQPVHQMKTYGGFHKWGSPKSYQIIQFTRIFHFKSSSYWDTSILGNHQILSYLSRVSPKKNYDSVEVEPYLEQLVCFGHWVSTARFPRAVPQGETTCHSENQWGSLPPATPFPPFTSPFSLWSTNHWRSIDPEKSR